MTLALDHSPVTLEDLVAEARSTPYVLPVGIAAPSTTRLDLAAIPELSRGADVFSEVEPAGTVTEIAVAVAISIEAQAPAVVVQVEAQTVSAVFDSSLKLIVPSAELVLPAALVLLVPAPARVIVPATPKAPTAPIPYINFPATLNGRTLDAFLLECVKLPGLADILMQSGDYVWGKLQGIQRRLTERRLEPEEVELVAGLTYGLSAIGKINSGTAIDFRAEVHRTIDDTVSFRANATRCRVGPISDGVSITMRYVTDVPRPLASLGLEQEVLDNLFFQYGLMLVVGTTGSGKSTILSSAKRERLEHRLHDPVKIGSFEDPIEYTYQDMGLGQMPLVTQVEIGEGRHLNTFGQAGPNAMRRGFDVLILGEMRDRASVEAGFELAMTGHAVYATLHVETPAQVIDRIVSFFPEDAQPSAASKLRSVLRMVLAQKQFPNTLGVSERVRSWCVFDRAVNARLAETKFHQWERIITEICAERGTDFDSRVLDILKAGRLTFERFRNVTGFTRAEALVYCEQKGIDVNTLE